MTGRIHASYTFAVLITAESRAMICSVKYIFKHPMVSVAAHSKAVIMLLFMHLLLLFPACVWKGAWLRCGKLRLLQLCGCRCYVPLPYLSV